MSAQRRYWVGATRCCDFVLYKRVGNALDAAVDVPLLKTIGVPNQEGQQLLEMVCRMMNGD